ncbi:MAG: hypothetical protein HY998_07620 [candidate division NC10 bacterium]|nr:hypothetical protein [candidate division NC10 bacterium]
MKNKTPQIDCPIFLEEENKIRELTNGINKARRLEEKAKLALALLEEVDVLLNCQEFDDKRMDCINCRRVSELRKKTAELIIKAREALDKLT